MLFAGLWERCATKDHGDLESFTIVTQPAGAELNGYHDRAPVILRPNEWQTWLDTTADVTQILAAGSANRFYVSRAEI